MHLLAFGLESLRAVWFQEWVLHIALRSDARPTVVQDEDTLVPAVVRPHPGDLDGTSVEVAQEQLREVVEVGVAAPIRVPPAEVHADARGRGEEIPEAEKPFADG